MFLREIAMEAVSMVTLCLLLYSVQCAGQPHPRTWGLDPDGFKKDLNKLKAKEKIKQQILVRLGLRSRPTSPTITDKQQIYVKLIHNITDPRGRPAEVNEIISFSEAPENFTDDNIIQFRFAKDTSGRRLIVKSANLLIRVKNKRKQRRMGTSPKKSGPSLRNGRRKRRKRKRGRKVALTVSTVGIDGRPLEEIAAMKYFIRKNNWFKMTLPQSRIQSLVDTSNGKLLLHVRCSGCRKNTRVVLVHSGKRKKRQLHSSKHSKRRKRRKLNKGRPFLILHTLVEARSQRTKRGSGNQCSLRRRRNRCCRRQIYVNFREIGWDDWILAPDGFTTAECAGTCLSRNSTETNTTERRCVPTKRRALRLIYQEINGVFVSSLLPNFIVTRCGCQH